MYKTWYVKKKEFETYLKKYAPKPRPYKQTTSVVHLEDSKQTPEESLLDALGLLKRDN